MYGYENLVELSYWYNKLIDFKLVSNYNDNATIEIDDNYFVSPVKEVDVTKCSKELIELNNYLKKMNINYLYIQAPTKIEKNQKISKIYNDYSNYNMDKLLNLIKNKVDYIDLRNNIANSTFEYKSLFFYLLLLNLFYYDIQGRS